MEINSLYIDVMTGVYNRHYLDTEGEKEITSFIARNIPFSLVIIDIDHFKEINDVHGHARGDEVLKAFGSFIARTVRASDRVIRYGGDEFLCIMPNTLRNDAESIYLRILKILKNVDFSGLQITLSVGIASYPGDGRDFQGIFEAADKALYDAKHHGRDRISVPGVKRAVLPINVFIDRKQEKEDIKGFLMANEKGLRAVMISGIVGIGKTRLSKEVLSDIKGKEIVWCDCMYFAEHIAYYPVREMIKYRLQRSGREWLRGIPAVYKVELSKLVPELLEESQASNIDAVLDKYRLYESVRRMIDIDQREKVIIVDNAQWIDDASLEVMKYLVRALRECAVSFLFLYRTEERPAELDDFFRFIHREVMTKEVTLPVLQSNEVREAVRAILGDEPETKLVDYVVRGSGGNPFYIEEIIRMLIDEKHLRVEADKWRFNEPAKELLPKTLADIVARNYRMLNPDAQNVLELASVIGWFDVNTLSMLTGSTEVQVMDWINDISRLGLVKYVQDRFLFSEVISRQVIYKKFVEGLKGMDLHRRVVEQLENKYQGRERDVVEDLAIHSYMARDRQRGIRYCRLAAAQAQNKYANKSVIGYCTWILELLGEPSDVSERGQKIDCLLERAEVFRRIGDLKSALNDLETGGAEARAINDLARQAEIKRAKAVLLMANAQYQDALCEAESSLELMYKAKSEEEIPRVLITIGGIYGMTSDNEKSFDAYQQAYAMIADRGKRDDVWGDACSGKGVVLYLLGKYNEAMDEYAKALSAYRETGNKPAGARVLNNMANIQEGIGNYSRARKLYEEACQVFELTGDRKGEAMSHVNSCTICARVGDFLKAKQHNEAALKIAVDIGDVHLELFARFCTGTINVARGEFETARICYGEIIRKADEVKLDYLSFEAKIQLTQIYLETGQLTEARSIMDEIGKSTEGLRDRQILFLPAAGNLCIAEGRAEEFKKTIADLEQIFAGMMPKVMASDLLVSRGGYYSLEKDFGNAEHFYRLAMAVFKAGGEKPRLGKVHLKMGQMEQMRGNEEKAQEYFRSAREIFTAIGAEGWAKKTEEVIKGK